MKKIIHTFLSMLSLLVLSAFPVFAKDLVSESTYIKAQGGLYWAFTVPEQGIDYLIITCTTSMEYTSKMMFGVCQTESDASRFYSQGRYACLPGTYLSDAQGYTVQLEGLTPGKTYYFVAFNDSYGIFSASGYDIEVNIFASVKCGWLGLGNHFVNIGEYYDYDYRQMVKDKLIETGAHDYIPLVQGVIVTFVYPDSPADLCGIKADDIITSFGGVDLNDNKYDYDGSHCREQFCDLLDQTIPGGTYTIKLMRFEDGVWKQKIVNATLIERPEP